VFESRNGQTFVSSPALLPNGYLGVKQEEPEAEDSPSSDAEFKNAWSFISTRFYAFVAGRR